MVTKNTITRLCQSRDYHNQQCTSPQTKAPRFETVFSSRPQICFQTCRVIQHFSTPEIYTPDIVQTLPQVSKSDIYLKLYLYPSHHSFAEMHSYRNLLQAKPAAPISLIKTSAFYIHFQKKNLPTRSLLNGLRKHFW